MRWLLVIDDDEDARHVLGESLRKAGYETVVAAGGAEGVQLFQSGGVDLVIIDIWMPEKDGLETLMEIRRIDRGSKIIAISGGGRLGLTSPLSWASQMGAKSILTKPFSHEELLAVVSDVLAR